MENPFILTAYKGPEYFCDRKKETHKLREALINHRNITLYSPRRMGKTGLIKHLMHTSRKNFNSYYLDIYKTQSLSGLVRELSIAVFKSIMRPKTRIEKALAIFKSIRPKVAVDPITGFPELEIDFVNTEQAFATLTDIFTFLEQSDKLCIIAIDEFQQITNYKETNTEALLREQIQNLNNCSFIFCGSQKHLLTSIFNDAGRPFFGSTQFMHLDTIDREVYGKFIAKKFKEGNKTIATDVIAELLDWTRVHTFNVQLLCNRLYGLRTSCISSDILREITSQVLHENENIYLSYRSILTQNQWKLLKAIAAEEIVDQPTASSFMKEYGLGSGSSVSRALDSLIDSDLVLREETENDSLYFVQDVFLSRWLQHVYNK